MIIIWCISITNNVKSYKKNHRNSSNIQFQWFPIDSLWKWSKRDQNYGNANAFSRIGKFLRYSGYAIGKLTSRAFRKCGGLVCYNFLTPSYCCPKSGQISRIILAKLRCQKKKTRLQFSISSLHMNRTWVSHGTFQVLFISEVKTQNCGRGIFF